MKWTGWLVKDGPIQSEHGFQGVFKRLAFTIRVLALVESIHERLWSIPMVHFHPDPLNSGLVVVVVAVVETGQVDHQHRTPSVTTGGNVTRGILIHGALERNLFRVGVKEFDRG